jgi:hypothetical protein
MTSIEWLETELKKIPFVNPKEVFEQAKEMHDKEMIEFAEYVATYPDKNVNANGEMLHAKSRYDGAERTCDLLETFKK